MLCFIMSSRRIWKQIAIKDHLYVYQKVQSKVPLHNQLLFHPKKKEYNLYYKQVNKMYKLSQTPKTHFTIT